MRDAWLRRRGVLALGVALPAARAAAQASGQAPGQALQQPWSPPRPVRIVVGYPPGGGADTTARLLAGPLGAFLGQPVVVESRPGAASTIGAGEVARAAPDGTTLLLDSAGHTMAPALIRGLPFDYATAFTPISRVVLLPQVLAVRADSPHRDLSGLLARARAAPGRATYASSGNGGAQHVTALLLFRQAGVEVTHVPYRGGSPAMAALLAGDVDCAVATITSALALTRDGKVRALAATGAARIASLPDVPTAAEQGIGGFDQNEWNGVLAPAGLPAAALARLHGGCLHALADAVVRQRLAALGAEPLGTSPADFAAFLARDRSVMAALVKEAGITAD